jgi:hypothetical membrane protein
MTRDPRLLFGPLAAAVLLLGVAGLPLMLPGYDPVRQTVSEIGEVGSPARVPFTLLLCLVAAGVVVFAAGLDRVAREMARPRWAAWLTGAMAVSVAGVGVFAFPHPLHNVFGLSEMVGYQAPLVLALTWRGDPRLRGAVAISAVMAVAVWVMIGLNLSSIARDGAVWAHLKPVNGLVQRGLFAAWFGWAAMLGARLYSGEKAPG